MMSLFRKPGSGAQEEDDWEGKQYMVKG